MGRKKSASAASISVHCQLLVVGFRQRQSVDVQSVLVAVIRVRWRRSKVF